MPPDCCWAGAVDAERRWAGGGAWRRGAGGGGRLIMPPPPLRPPRPMLFLAVWKTGGVSTAVCRAARSPQRRRRGLSDIGARRGGVGDGRRLCASDLERLDTLGNEPCVRTES